MPVDVCVGEHDGCIASDACSIYTLVHLLCYATECHSCAQISGDTSDPPTPFQSQSTSATSHTAAGNSVTGPASNTVQILYSSKSNGKHSLSLTSLHSSL